MRLGVVAEVVLAMVVFAARPSRVTPPSPPLSIHRARQGVVANEAYLELGSAVDAAWKSLNDFAPALGRGASVRLDPDLPLALGWRASTWTARWAPSSLPRRSLARLDAATSRRGGANRRAGRRARRGGERARRCGGRRRPQSALRVESDFAMLTHSLIASAALARRKRQIAQRLSDDEETALSMAVALGAAGLAVAGAAFIFTLRHCGRSASRARGRGRWRGGDYAQRTGVTSHDEIGDLAASSTRWRRHRRTRAAPDRSERLATVGRMARDRRRGPKPAGVDRSQRGAARRRDRGRR